MMDIERLVTSHPCLRCGYSTLSLGRPENRIKGTEKKGGVRDEHYDVRLMLALCRVDG